MLTMHHVKFHLNKQMNIVIINYDESVCNPLNFFFLWNDGFDGDSLYGTYGGYGDAIFL